jgi:hypothetical protein
MNPDSATANENERRNGQAAITTILFSEESRQWLICMRSVSVPPNPIAPIRPLPKGSASVHFETGSSVGEFEFGIERRCSYQNHCNIYSETSQQIVTPNLAPVFLTSRNRDHGH